MVVYIDACLYLHLQLCTCAQSLSHTELFVTLCTVASQVTLYMGFSRPQYLSGLPFPSLGDLSDPGIKPWSSALQTDSFTI